VQIYESEIGPERRAFDDWQTGEELFAQLDAEHDLLDRDLRPFIEECDQMQGLQLFTGIESSWAGFSARYVDRLRDELGKMPLWIWALGEGPSTTLVRSISTRVWTLLNIDSSPDAGLKSSMRLELFMICQPKHQCTYH